MIRLILRRTRAGSMGKSSSSPGAFGNALAIRSREGRSSPQQTGTPISVFLSMRRTSAPCSAAYRAAVLPAGPAPTTSRSTRFCIMGVVGSPSYIREGIGGRRRNRLLDLSRQGGQGNAAVRLTVAGCTSGPLPIPLKREDGRMRRSEMNPRAAGAIDASMNRLQVSRTRLYPDGDRGGLPLED
ncbi:hypothetical protein ASZ90_009675 [hydrocarbon metagenome]|uniref:Uncharacterized protein n=1 Tax=hydrocarbon metagenome TaxID=938273 RepID=A0A0W8FI47_9ZZZZ